MFGSGRHGAVLPSFGADVGVETLKTIGMLCGAGLFVLLLFAIYGLDLSPGFF